MRKPNPTTYRLTFEDALLIWHLYWSGIHQHHIAARFGVNPGRVSEVIKERKHIGSREAALRGNAA